MTVEERPGPARTGVWVITDLTEKNCIVGKIIVAYPRDGAGRLYAALWDWTGPEPRDVQEKSVGGYGYDKNSAAIDDMLFGHGAREFRLDCDGTGMNTAAAQFRVHGYALTRVL